MVMVSEEESEMLANFTIVRTFYKLRVTLIVDCVKKDADISVTYDRRLRHCQPVRFDLCSTPEIAERYLSRADINHPEHGNMIEALEAQYRLKFGIAA
jgi:hypothetical protein